MSLGENILNLRKKNRLSQEQLGEKTNVTRQTISNWELNETAPNPEQLKLLSKALKVSIDELVDNDISSILVVTHNFVHNLFDCFANRKFLRIYKYFFKYTIYFRTL